MDGSIQRIRSKCLTELSVCIGLFRGLCTGAEPRVLIERGSVGFGTNKFPTRSPIASFPFKIARIRCFSSSASENVKSLSQIKISLLLVGTYNIKIFSG